LSAEQAAALERRLAAFEQETSHQIVLLTVPSLEGDPIEDFSIRVAESWKIGHKGLDNGILFVIARDDHKARIEVGRGLEGVVPDVIASRILGDRVFPLFRAGRVPDGVDAGIDALIAAARGEEIPVERRPAHRESEGPIGEIVLWALLGGFLAAPFRRGRLRLVGALLAGGLAGGLTYLFVRSALWTALAAALGAIFGWVSPASAPLRRGPTGFGPVGPWGGGFGGGFGGGGGGFSGGGGEFGGGGASGSW
jgi:uncharacterized protein